jgi:arginine/lysine/ornithine decarboxylase
VLSPREAFFARHEELSLERAEGRISADSLVLYPPGIANVLPGERITGGNVEHLLTMTRRGCVLRGTSGGSLERVRVVR